MIRIRGREFASDSARPPEYAGATGKHPSTVYLREADVTPALDVWLLRIFDPNNIDGAVAALAAAQAPDDAAVVRAEDACRKIAECDTRLANLRRQIEGGNPSDVVLTWVREAEAERLVAERELASATPAAKPLTEAEIRALVGS